MKQIPLLLLALLIAVGCAKFNSELQAQTGAKPLLAVTDTITLFSNGYVYPEDQYDSYGSIFSEGLVSWKDSSGFTRVFFYPQSTGSISVSIRLKAPKNANTLKIRLDSSGTIYNVVVNKTSDYITLNVGNFHISSSRYHCLEIKAATKNGYLPNVQAVIITSSLGLKYNRSQYRGAPATHLSYPVPHDSAIAWFYNEIYVPTGADPLYSYYMVNGFGDGYFGIQVNSPTERRVLFSIWSNFNTDNPSQIPADYAVTLVKKGSDITSNPFGNEGSGGQSYLKFPWKTGNTYKLLVHAEAAGTHTIYTGYFYAPETGSWKLIAQWNKSKTNGKLLGGLYSFVENFSENGNDYFKARYGNQWVRTVNGNWIELNKAAFTTTAGESVHQRYDIGAGLENNFFYMYSGGFKEAGNSVGQSYQRPTTGTPPAVNLATLPTN
ncbi:uncharacterized protein DUF5077 [Chitinophaga niastensis]|uniref:Uncharacterized protein DUF5077 n=1 Tax=Chitinophaga niastensis TaxID=536980 RepID=A0A2P8HMG5_CHINA|nr:DUF3472 domain-containing protein [Chitinophaga niastensis]PSL47418.1 uncharacterized protein DUF5077 [Chitinophaga niastensis]